MCSEPSTCSTDFLCFILNYIYSFLHITILQSNFLNSSASLTCTQCIAFFFYNFIHYFVVVLSNLNCFKLLYVFILNIFSFFLSFLLDYFWHTISLQKLFIALYLIPTLFTCYTSNKKWHFNWKAYKLTSHKYKKKKKDFLFPFKVASGNCLSNYAK